MIVVFGAINMDVNFRVKNLPEPGETVLSPDYTMTPGGKGANQALAAARMGAKTAIVGKVGDDGNGNRILMNLRRNEVMTSGVARSESLPTGMAMVTRDSNKQKQIIVGLGANADITADQVPDEILTDRHMLLTQMEVPVEENFTLMQRAKENGATVILNLAPAIKISTKALKLLDYLIVNQIEARQMGEALGLSGSAEFIKIAQALSKEGDLTCIVTMGEKGSVAVTKDGKGYSIAGMKLEDVVDIAGAGDCYCGTFAACIYANMSLPDAMKYATVASGLSCKVRGIQEAYPYSGDIKDHLDSVESAKAVML